MVGVQLSEVGWNPIKRKYIVVPVPRKEVDYICSLNGQFHISDITSIGWLSNVNLYVSYINQRACQCMPLVLSKPSINEIIDIHVLKG